MSVVTRPRKRGKRCPLFSFKNPTKGGPCGEVEGRRRGEMLYDASQHPLSERRKKMGLASAGG